jgi:hypothetical protein
MVIGLKVHRNDSGSMSSRPSKGFGSRFLQRQEPVRQPWLQRVTGEVAEGLAMLHASAHADQAASVRLRSEAAAKISEAVAGIPQSELAQR